MVTPDTGGRTTDPAPLGHDQMDGEHVLLHRLLAALRNAVGGEAADAEIEPLVASLIDFAKVHFSSEQLLMRLYAYPDFDRHVADHDRAIAILEELRDRWRAGEREWARAAFPPLAEQMLAHTNYGDRAFTQWLDQKKS